MDGEQLLRTASYEERALFAPGMQPYAFSLKYNGYRFDVSYTPANGRLPALHVTTRGGSLESFLTLVDVLSSLGGYRDTWNETMWGLEGRVAYHEPLGRQALFKRLRETRCVTLPEGVEELVEEAVAAYARRSA